MKAGNFPFGSNKNQLNLINRFEDMLAKGDNYFFDVAEFEDILEYYSLRNKVEKAFKVVYMAKSQHPSVSSFVLREAELLASTNRGAEALRTIEKIEGIEGINTEIFMTKASIFSQQGQYKQAIKTLKDALKHSPGDMASIYMTMSYEYQNLNKMELSIQCLKEILKSQPTNTDVLYELSYCFDLWDQHKPAVDFYTSYIDEYPYSEHAWFNLGNAYSWQKKYEKAVEAYDFALVIDPIMGSALFNKAHTQVDMKRYDDAIATYMECLKYDRDPGMTHYYLGECYEGMGKYASALKHYRKSTQDDPGYPDAWVGAARTLDYLDRLPEAIPYLERAVKMQRVETSTLLALADAYARTGETIKAVGIYKKAIQQDETNIETYSEYAEFMQGLGLFEEATAVLTKGINNNPSLPELYYRLAALYMEGGEKSNGIEVLQQALDMEAGLSYLLFDYFDGAKKIPEVIDLIELYKNNE